VKIGPVRALMTKLVFAFRNFSNAPDKTRIFVRLAFSYYTAVIRGYDSGCKTQNFSVW